MFRTALRSSYSIIRSAAPFAQRHLSTETRDAIQKAINQQPVVVFMKGTPLAPECGFSRAVVQVLDIHDVPEDKMKTYNVLSDPELRSGIKEFSEWPTIPQIYVNGEFLGGCDILLAMHQSGELRKLLVNHKIVPEEDPSES